MPRRLLPSVAVVLFALSCASTASAQGWAGASVSHAAAPVHVADTPRGLNVRSGPGTAYPRVGVLPRGEGGRVAGCEPAGRWCLLRFDGGGEGWVYMPLTRPAATPASLGTGHGGIGHGGPPVDWQRLYRPDVPYVHAGTGRVNLRQGAGTHRRIVGKLAPGQGGFVQGCSADARWCLLTVPPHGVEGWVYMPLLRPLSPVPFAASGY